jgi:uncharacterized protein YjiS (DUF1127 family)
MTDISLSIQATTESLGEKWQRATTLYRAWRVRARERRELAGMSAYELADIGLSRSDRNVEISKPFWRR